MRGQTGFHIKRACFSNIQPWNGENLGFRQQSVSSIIPHMHRNHTSALHPVVLTLGIETSDRYSHGPHVFCLWDRCRFKRCGHLANNCIINNIVVGESNYWKYNHESSSNRFWIRSRISLESNHESVSSQVTNQSRIRSRISFESSHESVSNQVPNQSRICL